MILGILMSDEVKIAVLETQVERLLDKQKELTERVRANEKVVAAIGLLGSIAVAFIGAGYFAPKAEAEPRYINDLKQGKLVYIDTRDDKPLVIMETYYHMVDAIRNWKQEKERTPIEDMLNNTLTEYEYGSNDPTEQEELLQLPSDGD